MKNIIQEGYDNEIINKEKYEGMISDDKHSGKFYCLFKIHKAYEEGSTPPEAEFI